MTINQRDELLKSLRGQKVRMPDLRPIFAGWPGTYGDNINPYWKDMVITVDERLQG